MERDVKLSTFRRVASWIEIAFAFLLLLVGGLFMVASISDPSSDPHGALGGVGVVAIMAAAAFFVAALLLKIKSKWGWLGQLPLVATILFILSL